MSYNFYENVLRFAEEDILKSSFEHEVQSIYISPASLLRILTNLRDHKQFCFDQLVDIVSVDYPKATKRFELTYHLLSHKYNKRIFIKVSLKDGEPISTVLDVYCNALWYEREVFDLMGIYFTGHPDLRRILTDYNFDGHPLRKDFPLYGYTQVYYNEKECKLDLEAAQFENPYRDFDFISNWEGVLKK
jgi:NADH-quinone oxidoreductase subunit C